jgi:uncharacterized protein YndB with AHSA1/START domain
MPAIVKELTIAAAPGSVYNALTLQDEIARWWTNDLSVTPEVGSLAEIRFSQGTFVYQFEIAELNADEKVYWITRQGPSTGQGPASPGNSRLSTTEHRWSSTMMGSPRLIRDMN